MFVIAVGIAIGAATAGASGQRGDDRGPSSQSCDDGGHRHGSSCTTTTKPHVTSTTKRHVTTTTTTTEPESTTTTTTAPTTTVPFGSDVAPPAAAPPASPSGVFGGALGRGSARRLPVSQGGPFLPLVPPQLPPAAATPGPTPGIASPLDGFTQGPGGVPMSMIVVIAMAGAATVLLVLRGALGRAQLVPADEGETVGFE